MCGMDAMRSAPIGRIIKRARERRRISQAKAAAALGVSRSALNAWENDRAYPRSSIGALEDFYGISLDGEPEPEPEPAVPQVVVDAIMTAVEPERRQQAIEAVERTLRGEPQPPTGPGAAGASSGASRRAG